jgi:hypothetical protein
MQNKNENKDYKTEIKQHNKSLIIQSGLRIVFLGLALVGTIWMIATINSGRLFQNPNSATSILLGIPAQKSN